MHIMLTTITIQCPLEKVENIPLPMSDCTVSLIMVVSVWK